MALIAAEDLGLEYDVYGASSRSFKTSLIKAATGGLLKSEERTVKVQALEGIDFQLKDGDRLGLVGHNGAGKSSLLKVLAQIYSPSQGKLKIAGRTNCLFDIMVGLESTLSGYENIKIKGLLFGLSKKEIVKAIPEIVEFAELGEFIHLPLRAYSSGMLLRLGFSIVTHFLTEILLIDEVVNVGDAGFLQKAKARMKSLIHQTQIVVISTHDHSLLKEFCTHILCLEQGKMQFLGSAKDYFKS